ncbi:ATP-dependent DNA ligase [Acinetobacter nosocomialis]|uniref:ATP-dependent DNA ligase n=1 Tax=Acinetobacter nosocomialis TaxID=106654 RepID=UPI0033A24A3B
MNSDQVLEALNHIASTSSKNEKLALLKHYQADKGFFSEILRLAYDPFIVFGLLPKADDAGTGELMFDEVDTIEFLFKLNNRDLTGNAAREALRSQLAQLSQKSGELLIRILRKDLRAGFSEGSINKVAPGLVPIFPYQRCSLAKDVKLDTWPWEKGIYSQEKADGMFANGTNLEAKFFLSSRQGTPLPMEHFADLAEEMQQLIKEVQYHGELLVERDGVILPREIGNGILNSVAKGGSFAENEKPVYLIWDFIPFSAVCAKGKFEAAYQRRITLIKTMLDKFKLKYVRMIETRIVHSLEEAYEHFFELLKQGKEGTIIKHPEGHWKDGTSKEQVKLKLEADCELVVTAINEGKLGSKNEGRAGALSCMSACGKLVVDVAIKNEKMRDEVDANPSEWLGKIITVRANAILKPSESNFHHSLFLPRMVDDHYRLDKTEADDLTRIQSQFDNAIQGK